MQLREQRSAWLHMRERRLQRMWVMWQCLLGCTQVGCGQAKDVAQQCEQRIGCWLFCFKCKQEELLLLQVCTNLCNMCCWASHGSEVSCLCLQCSAYAACTVRVDASTVTHSALHRRCAGAAAGHNSTLRRVMGNLVE